MLPDDPEIQRLAHLAHLYFLGFAVVFGALVGSFLNVVVYRLPAGLSVAKPRSHCPACKTPVAWFDNIPVFSWMFLRAKCRHCGARISMRYPMVELAGAVLAALVFLRLVPGPLALTYGHMAEFVLYFSFFAALLALALIDLDCWLLPNAITLPGTAIGLVVVVTLDLLGLGQVAWWQSLVGAAAGYGGMWLVGTLGNRAFKKKLEQAPEGFDSTMGGGDLKLMAMIGAWLGAWPTLLMVLLLASLAGSVIGITARIATRGRAGGHIPFGPFLAMGALLYFLAGPEIIDGYWSFLGPEPLPY